MEAIQILGQWQQKLSDARRALETFEANMGEAALLGDTSALAAQLVQLRAAVTVAAAAVETERRKAGNPLIPQKRQQLEQALALAAERNAAAQKWTKIYEELEPKVAEANRMMHGFKLEAMRYEDSAGRLQYELNTLLAQPWP